jgi:internalin A
MTPDQKGRRGLQFSLRSSLVVFTIVAVMLAWLAYERSQVQAKRNAIEAITALNGFIRYDDKNTNRPKWIRYVLGDDMPGEVVEIGLGGMEATTEHFAPLKNFPRLESLSLMFVKIDASVVRFDGLSELQSLAISADELSDEALGHLAKLPHLRSLEIQGGHVTGSGLAHLEGLAELESLALHTPVRNDGMKHLIELHNLRDLDLCKTDVTDEGLDNVALLTKLEYLRLNGLKVSDNGLPKLQPLKGLKTLHLRYCIDVTDDGLKHLANFKQLENLEIGPSITDAGLPSLEVLPQLKDVSLWQTTVTQEGIDRLRIVFPKIEVDNVGPPIGPGVSSTYVK